MYPKKKLMILPKPMLTMNAGREKQMAETLFACGLTINQVRSVVNRCSMVSPTPYRIVMKADKLDKEMMRRLMYFFEVYVMEEE